MQLHLFHFHRLGRLQRNLHRGVVSLCVVMQFAPLLLLELLSNLQEQYTLVQQVGHLKLRHLALEVSQINRKSCSGFNQISSACDVIRVDYYYVAISRVFLDKTWVE